MRTLAERAAQAGSETNTGIAEFIAQFVGRAERVFPALLPVAFEQIDLSRLGRER